MCNACWETGAQGQCPFTLASFAANTGYNYFKQCSQQNTLPIWLNLCSIIVNKHTTTCIRSLSEEKNNERCWFTNLFSSSAFSRSGTDCGSDHCLPICSIDQGRSLLHDWYILRLPLRRDVPPFNASASDRMCSTGARWTRGVETFALPNHRLRLGVPERGGRCLVRRDARRGSFPVKATGSCHANSCNHPSAVSVLSVVGTAGEFHSLVSRMYLVTTKCPLLSVGGDEWVCVMSESLNRYALIDSHSRSKPCYPLLQFSTQDHRKRAFKHYTGPSQIPAISFNNFVGAL